MLNDNSAQVRDGIPHANSVTDKRISDAVRRRAKLLINDKTVDDCVRAFIQFTLENEDPYLTKLVRRVDAGESILMMSPLAKTKSTQIKNEGKRTSSAKNTT
jgi:hypothetical protein